MGHNCALLTLNIIVVLLFVICLVFNYMASSDVGQDIGLYESNTGDISDKYYIEITPAGWTFSIWGFIYTWQVLWIVYSVVNFFRSTDTGPAYSRPVLLSIPFLVSYAVNMLLNCTWMVVFDREVMEAAFAVLLAMCITLYICLFCSYRSLDKAIDTLIKQERKKDVWLTRILTQNGLAMYATWCTIATLLNLAIVLTYRSSHDIDQRDACTVALAVLSAEIVAFLVSDFFFLDRYSRYTFTPYIVLVVGLSGSLAKNYEAGARNSIFTAILLGIAVASGLIKVILMIWRHCKRTEDGVRITQVNGYRV